MHDETLKNVTVSKMSEKTKALLSFISYIIGFISSIAILFVEAIRNDGTKTVIYCMCCGWLICYFCSRTIKTYKHYRELKGY